jgi:hypothetical protein
MKFSYYKNLNQRQRRIYDRSDNVGSIAVPGVRDLVPWVAGVADGLRRDDRGRTEEAVQRLVAILLSRLHVPAVSARVLAVRPSNHREELHGLYEFGGNRRQPVISVWMRTAQRRQTVAFRSFMRTLLHEVVHHLDYHLLRLEDSYHTQGFYKRAESLYRQLVPADMPARAERPRPAPEREPRMAEVTSRAAARSPRGLPPGARPAPGVQRSPRSRVSAASKPTPPSGAPAAPEEQLLLPFTDS